jgi:hypothetical protein
LDGLARQRRKGWKGPRLDSDNRTEDEWRRYLRQYALLLRNDFQDILTAPRTDAPQRTQSDSDTDPDPEPEPQPGQPIETRTAGARVTGALLALAAFVAMVVELRYFTVNNTPEATGGTRGNLGLMIMMGLPWIALITGLLQLFSGVYIHKYETVFATMTLWKRIGVGVAAIGLSILVTAMAAMAAS